MLYLLKSGNYLKIGYAKNIEERMKLYTTHNPDFELLDTAEGTLLDEKELHKVCKRWQHRTEWYDYNEEVIKIFKEFTTRNKSEVIFKFLIIKEENSEVEIIDICKDNCDDYSIPKSHRSICIIECITKCHTSCSLSNGSNSFTVNRKHPCNKWEHKECRSNKNDNRKKHIDHLGSAIIGLLFPLHLSRSFAIIYVI